MRNPLVHGEFSSDGKSDLSTRRSVPMTDEVHDALEKWHKRTAHGESDRLVFAHPEAGTPLDRTKVTRYFQSACVAAGVRVIRFHDLRCPNPRGPGMLRLLTVAGARQPT